MISQNTNSEYHEVRFRKNEACKVKQNGNKLEQSEKTCVKIQDLENMPNIECKVDSNPDQWLVGIPTGEKIKSLTFPSTEKVTTNSIKIDDKSLTVHQYTFDIFVKKAVEDSADNKENTVPSNTPIDNLERAVLTKEQKEDIYYKIRRELKKLYPSQIDNTHIFSFSKSPPKETQMVINARRFSEYVIVLTRQYSSDPNVECHNTASDANIPFRELVKSCSMRFKEQGMNILNRDRFKSANYAQLHKREDKYYSLQNLQNMELWQQNGKSLQFPDLRLLKGYKSTVVYSQHCITKTQLANKLICAHSVHDLIAEHGVDKVNEFITGKRAITSYSNQIVELDGLDSSKSLETTFDLKDGTTISYGDYYRIKRKIKLLKNTEQALVIHHNYFGRGKDKKLRDTIYYLPQLLYVIVPVEQHNDFTKQKLRRLSHPNVQTIINKAMEINKTLKSVTKTAPFTTHSEPVKVTGYNIDFPFICFKDRNGLRRESVNDGNGNEFGGRAWSNVNSFWYNLRDIGSNNPNIPSIAWAICYNEHSGYHYAKQIVEAYHGFNQKRRFKQAPLGEPDLIGMDYSDLVGIRKRLRGSKYAVALFILPDHGGSNIKVDITRHVLFYNEPHSALSTPNGSPIRSRVHRNDRTSNNLRMDLQFICQSTIRKRNAVFNVLETLMLKAGVILYYVEPKLPSKLYCTKRVWMICIKILRKKGGDHLLVINCNRAPFVGSIKYMTNHSSMIPSTMDVIPQHMMRQLTMSMLKANVSKVAISRGEEQMPLNIIILRASGGDGLLKTIISKEVAGFKQSLSEFKSKHTALIEQANGVNVDKAIASKWYPGIQFSVYQDNVVDAFGIVGSRSQRIEDSPNALVVNEGITSSQYLDIFISLPTKQERQLYGRVIRLVTLCDEYNSGKTKKGRPDKKDRLRVNEALLSDYIALIYASTWSYALNIPFPKVPNYPAPLKFAEHYASWQWSILTDDDTDLQDLKIDVDNPKPRICAVVPENAVIANTDNDVQMK